MLTIQELGKRIVLVVFHADDGAINFNGTLKRAIDDGAEVTVIVVSDSRGDNGEDLSEIRRQEERQACKLTGIRDLRFLEDYPDGQVAQHKPRLIRELAGIFRRLQPTAVFTFDPDNGLTGHRDHREGADCVEQAIIETECSCLMVMAAITVQWKRYVMPSLRELADAIYIDVPLPAVPDSELDLVVRLSDDELADKVLAVMVHESQMLLLIKKLARVGGLDFLIKYWFRWEAFTARRPWHPRR